MDKQDEDIKNEFDSSFFNSKIKLGKLSLTKKIITIFLLSVLFMMWFLYNSLYIEEAQSVDEVNFIVEKGQSITTLAEKLENNNIIKNKWLFKKYLVYKGIDKKVQAGSFTVQYPITLVRVANSLKNAVALNEKVITIIPGWDMRDIAVYFVGIGLVEDAGSLYKVVGAPATKYSNNAPTLDYDIDILHEKPATVSYEGYLAPNTYRIFDDATLSEILQKLILQQSRVFTSQMYEDIKKSKRNVHEILTMASIIEREVSTPAEKAKVSDIFWKRYDSNWGLQADSTVRYVTGRTGDVFTTGEERNIDNLWNTYEYPGLPPGPISAPDVYSIIAAIYPEKNDYWYFLTTLDGEVKYAKDLDEHNQNVRKYLR
ncbi:MAG: endolytic transglycosylase MltG [bacterium]|nr:endolytic transglycosylase MltG [bacterium]